MGILAGIPAGVENLVYLLRATQQAFGDSVQWPVCAAGQHQIPTCTAGVLLGGHIRVGLEDNLYVERGRLATSSAEQVQKMVRLVSELSIPIATPDEARAILNLDPQ